MAQYEQCTWSWIYSEILWVYLSRRLDWGYCDRWDLQVLCEFKGEVKVRRFAVCENVRSDRWRLIWGLEALFVLQLWLSASARVALLLPLSNFFTPKYYPKYQVKKAANVRLVWLACFSSSWSRLTINFVTRFLRGRIIGNRASCDRNFILVLIQIIRSSSAALFGGEVLNIPQLRPPNEPF